MGEFNPVISVKIDYIHVFTGNIRLTIRGLQPNQRYQFWYFYPDNSSPSQSSLSCNANGEIDEDMHLGSSGNSMKLIKGVHKIGFNKDTIDIKKYDFDTWLNESNEKKWVSFNIDYDDKPFLQLHIDKKIPWGKITDINGHLWYENEPFNQCFNAQWFMNKKIYFSGNNPIPESTTTDGQGKFSNQFEVGDIPKKECSLQSHYDGDDIYFRKCDSKITYYDIVKHNTSLSLQVKPLIDKFNISNSISNSENKMISKYFYLFSGQLYDIIFNRPVGHKIIHFESDIFSSDLSTVTDKNGYYELCYRIPDVVGEFEIKALFSTDEKYESSFHQIKCTIIRNTHSLYSEFKSFKAFDYLKSGFDESKEQPQISSTMWLLSILNINSIPLGIFKRDGEQVQENGKLLNFSVDILAQVDEVFLVIDCTVTVPDSQKIDKILNTASYLTKKTNCDYIPVLVSNQETSMTKEFAMNSKVVILDKKDIQEILYYIQKDNVIDGRKVFLSKLKTILVSRDKVRKDIPFSEFLQKANQEIIFVVISNEFVTRFKIEDLKKAIYNSIELTIILLNPNSPDVPQKEYLWKINNLTEVINKQLEDLCKLKRELGKTGNKLSIKTFDSRIDYSYIIIDPDSDNSIIKIEELNQVDPDKRKNELAYKNGRNSYLYSQHMEIIRSLKTRDYNCN